MFLETHQTSDVRTFEYDPRSVLSHFEATDLLDALSVGVVVLDADLCITYANVAAQEALAFRVDQSRGRPIGEIVGPSNGLLKRLRRVLGSGRPLANRQRSLRPFDSPRDARALDVTVSPLGSQVTGAHLLLQFADTR